MRGERSRLSGVLWRVAVVAMVLLYMLSLAREFLGATIVA